MVGEVFGSNSDLSKLSLLNWCCGNPHVVGPGINTFDAMTSPLTILIGFKPNISKADDINFGRVEDEEL